MEFLIGRTLGNALAALDLPPAPNQAAAHATPARWKTCSRREPDAALGNGGLGRLAACFLDSMATLGLPASATASATNSACSRRPSRAAARSSTPTLAGRRHALGVSACRVPTRCASAAGSSRPWSRCPAGAGLAARRRSAGQGLRHGHPRHGTEASARCGCGRPRRRPRSTCTPSTAATTRAPPSSRTSSRTSPGCCTRTTAPRPGANCGCAGVLLHQRRRSRTSWRATCAEHRHAGQPGRQGGHPPQRHPPGDRRGRADALLVDEHGLPGPPPGRSPATCSATPTTR
jgi:hypothetical protein